MMLFSNIPGQFVRRKYDLWTNYQSVTHVNFMLYYRLLRLSMGSPGGSVVKNMPANTGDIRDVGSVSGSGKSYEGGHGNPLQYSCLENPHGQRAWWLQSFGLQRVGHD